MRKFQRNCISLALLLSLLLPGCRKSDDAPSPDPARPASSSRQQQSELSRITPPELYNAPVEFRIGATSSEDLFKLLAEKVELNYVVSPDVFSGNQAVPPASAQAGPLLDELLETEQLALVPDAEAMAAVLRRAELLDGAEERAAAGNQARTALGDSAFEGQINIPSLPADTKADTLISLLGQRLRASISGTEHASRSVLVRVQKKSPGSVLLALLTALQLKLHKTETGEYVLQPFT